MSSLLDRLVSASMRELRCIRTYRQPENVNHQQGKNTTTQRRENKYNMEMKIESAHIKVERDGYETRETTNKSERPGTICSHDVSSVGLLVALVFFAEIDNQCLHRTYNAHA